MHNVLFGDGDERKHVGAFALLRGTLVVAGFAFVTSVQEHLAS